jgi:hypothetical protein
MSAEIYTNKAVILPKHNVSIAYLFFFKAFDNLGYKRDLNPKIACSYPEILKN